MDSRRNKKYTKDSFKKSKDIEMRSRSSSPMDIDMPKHIISKTGFQKDLKPAIEEEKDSQGSGRNESESVESENEESENEESENSNESNQDLNTVLNDENEKDEKDEQESHIQLKRSEIREKLNSYFRAGVSASELIKKERSWLKFKNNL